MDDTLLTGTNIKSDVVFTVFSKFLNHCVCQRIGIGSLISFVGTMWSTVANVLSENGLGDFFPQHAKCLRACNPKN